MMTVWGIRLAHLSLPYQPLRTDLKDPPCLRFYHNHLFFFKESTHTGEPGGGSGVANIEYFIDVVVALTYWSLLGEGLFQ
jgi:hypothetical protein